MNQITDKKIEWRIIISKIHGEELNPDNQAKFDAWLEASPAHRLYFERAVKAWLEPVPNPSVNYIGLENEIFVESHILPVQKHRQWFSRSLLRYAAVIIAVVGAGILWQLSRDTNLQKEESITEVFGHQPITPGQSRASLILADGKTVDLESGEQSGIINGVNGEEISISNGNITMGHSTVPVRAESVNTLVIPRGGEYSLTLSDGTKIWLNARTKLSFPSRFDGNTRKVTLEGEAYFEVKKDASRPFVVMTKQSEIRVYGTSFNIRSYPDDTIQETTLARGSIGVEYGGHNYMLSPGQQARVENGKVDVIKVDASVYCSWHKGLFVFENRKLDDILKQLSDWYDVDFIYQDNSLRNLHFTGDLERYSDFDTILSMIAMTTDVGFTVEGKNVTVYNSKTK